MNAVGGRDVVGKMLKSESGWELHNGTDEYGFTAVPAGYYDISIYDLEGKSALFLCSRDDEHLGSEYVDVVSINDRRDKVIVDAEKVRLQRRFSVRCLKD